MSHVTSGATGQPRSAAALKFRLVGGVCDRATDLERLPAVQAWSAGDARAADQGGDVVGGQRGGRQQQVLHLRVADGGRSFVPSRRAVT